VKMVQNGVQIKGTTTTSSDGTREHSITRVIANGTSSVIEDFIFKSNSTSYNLYLVAPSTEAKCDLSKLDDAQLVTRFPFQYLNEKGKGPGAQCKSAAGKSGSLWSLDETTTICVSDDGTTPFYFDSPAAGLIDAPINFTAKEPSPSVFQLPAACLGLDGKTLNLPKAYFANFKSVSSIYTTTGNVTRQENGDDAFLQDGQSASLSWFSASKQKTYSVYSWSNTCSAHDTRANYDDDLESLQAYPGQWTHTKEKCSDDKGDVWASTYSKDTLCTEKDGAVPVWYKTSYKTITWSNFRTTDLPPFELPELCKSA